MRRIRILVALGIVLACVAVATPAPAATPRATVATPWARDDTIGDASRPQGDVRKIEVANGRQQVTFTFRMQAAPVWDNFASARHTFMRFLVDWQGTSAAYNRRVTASYAEGNWHVVVYTGTGGTICARDGGVQVLPNRRYRFSVPTGGPVPCLGGAHVLRVAAAFTDDRDDSAVDDLRLDKVPNSGGYGPFIRLP